MQVLGKQHCGRDRKPGLMGETINQQMKNKQNIRNLDSKEGDEEGAVTAGARSGAHVRESQWEGVRGPFAKMWGRRWRKDITEGERPLQGGREA